MSTVETGSRNPPPPPYARDLRRALADAVEGEVRFGLGDRALYAYDASIFRQLPVGVVVPRHAEDVVAAIGVCRRFGAPVFARGGGTGLAGQTVNHAVCFDFSKYMNEVVELDPGRRQALVQPGVICDQLRDAAGAHGLTFGPDPATHDHATLGGMIGNNSCGTHSLTSGKTVDNVDELEVVTYDGTRMWLGATDEAQLQTIVAAGGRRGEIYAALRHIRDAYADVIRTGMPDIPRRVSGYNLDQLLPENGFHVARALVGSESTLALTLQARCRLVPSPAHQALVVLGYPDIPASADDVPWLTSFGPVGVEFFSRHVADNLRDKHFATAGLGLLPPGRCWVLVEFGADSQDEATAAAVALVAELRRGDPVPSHGLFVDPAEQAAVWAVRGNSVGSSRMPVGLGGHPGWPNWEDAAVPPARLGDYLRAYLRLLERYGYDGVIFGHWSQGCVHCRIDFDLRTAAGIATYRRFMEEAADLVVSFGGSLSGEHGDGHGRAELWPRMFPPRLMQAFEEFKLAWDPDGRMNPHKLVDAYPMDAHLREGTSYRPRELDTVFQYPQDGGSLAEAAGRCFGVGKCRHVEGGVMCPSFMVTREERHSTRGRARLLQEMADGSASLQSGWRSREVKEALDLCLACKGCRSDCPVGVDMATYKSEFLHHFYAGRPRPRQAYALGLINVWARLASRAPGLANAATNAPLLGDLVKAVGGIARGRQAPQFARQTFVDWFDGHSPAHPQGPRVLLWPDTFTNFFEPHVAVAAVEVLEAAGYHVVLPGARLCCGRPLYDYGMLTLARRYLQRILRVMGPDIDAGTPMVALEPSCLAVFRDELTNLYPRDTRAKRLAAQSFTLAEFLAHHAPQWPVPRLDRAALVQPHCHHHAVIGFAAESQLLERMGLRVTQPDSGCCGMAGSFGYEAGERYRVSVAAGERVLLPAVRAADPATLIVADGFSCRGQIAGGTDRHGMHIAEVLAMAIREGQAAPAGGAARQPAAGQPAAGRDRRGVLVAAGAALLAGAVVRRSLTNERRRG